MGNDQLARSTSALRHTVFTLAWGQLPAAEKPCRRNPPKAARDAYFDNPASRGAI
jgi:hypothetical protein